MVLGRSNTYAPSTGRPSAVTLPPYLPLSSLSYLLPSYIFLVLPSLSNRHRRSSQLVTSSSIATISLLKLPSTSSALVSRPRPPGRTFLGIGGLEVVEVVCGGTHIVSPMSVFFLAIDYHYPMYLVYHILYHILYSS